MSVSAMFVSVTTNVMPLEEGEDWAAWELEFVFKHRELGWVSSYTVSEPYLTKFKDWEGAAIGLNDGLNLYMGNGEGRLDVVDDDLVFVSAPSGGGGDTRACIRVPRACVEGPLLATLADAKARGLHFG